MSDARFETNVYKHWTTTKSDIEAAIALVHKVYEGKTLKPVLNQNVVYAALSSTRFSLLNDIELKKFTAAARRGNVTFYAFLPEDWKILERFLSTGSTNSFLTVPTRQLVSVRNSNLVSVLRYKQCSALYQPGEWYGIYFSAGANNPCYISTKREELYDVLADAQRRLNVSEIQLFRPSTSIVEHALSKGWIPKLEIQPAAAKRPRSRATAS